MAKALILCEKLLKLCHETFPNVETGEYLHWNCEQELHRIFDLIKEATLERCDIVVENFVEYDYANECSGVEVIEDSAEVTNSSDSLVIMDSENTSQEILTPISQEWESETIDNVNFTLPEMKYIVSYYDSIKRNKLACTKRRYSKVKDYKMIARFKKYLQKNGRKQEKIAEVEKYVKMKFDDAKARFLHVCERDMQRWGGQKARLLELPFKASRTWLSFIKRKYRYVSRKITKYVTKREIDSRDDLQNAAIEFVNEVTTACKGINPDDIYNFDESGFKYEFSPKRTLSFKGEKDTVGLLTSHNANSHSYTIMPLLSMSGKLEGKLLVCLQEPKGIIGPRVSETLEVPENIYLLASKSGKMDKALMKRWINDCVEPLTAQKSIVLIYDSWKGHLDSNLYENLKNDCKRFVIPAGTTSLAQPLDRHFFIEYKLFRRKIFDRVNLDEMELDLHKRQNVIKMHSLIYNQLQAPVFNALGKYAWFSCTYLTERVKFQSVNDKCFNALYDKCEHDNCTEESFMQCAHCNLYLCLTHCLVELHYHRIQE